MASKVIIPKDNTFMYYFYFMKERMNIFWDKIEQANRLTDDPILQEYKFTNVYRSCDRVSQYLIKDVIYKDINEYNPEDVLLRILVFKVFNRIETWKYLSQEMDIRINTFDVEYISDLLSKRQQEHPIFSNAYLMAGSHPSFSTIHCKHRIWLHIIDEYFIKNKGFSQILKSKSLEAMYNQLRNYPLIGDFLAYQYSIDFNYSPYLNFDEDSFVKAGIGAVRGIKKCFSSYGDRYEDAILYTYDNFDGLLCRYNCTDFRPLPGRYPKLIDLQNCFCETDKYLRVKLPDLRVGNVRIKQRYSPSSDRINYFFPPKWGVTL